MKDHLLTFALHLVNYPRKKILFKLDIMSLSMLQKGLFPVLEIEKTTITKLTAIAINTID